MKVLLFSNYLGDCSYNFQGSFEWIWYQLQFRVLSVECSHRREFLQEFFSMDIGAAALSCRKNEVKLHSPLCHHLKHSMMKNNCVQKKTKLDRNVDYFGCEFFWGGGVLGGACFLKSKAKNPQKKTVKKFAEKFADNSPKVPQARIKSHTQSALQNLGINSWPAENFGNTPPPLSQDTCRTTPVL